MFFFCFLTLSTVLTACSSSTPWVQAHAKYQTDDLQKMVVADLGDRWMLVRPDWFRRRLAHDPNTHDIYAVVESLLVQQYRQSVAATWQQTTLYPSDWLQNLETETIQISPQNFFKGALPAQGTSTPALEPLESQKKNILIIHELILGPNVKRNDFYNTQTAAADMQENRKRATQLGIIAPWTLWDAHRQRNLKTGISSVQVPWNEKNHLELSQQIQLLTQKLVQQIHCDLQEHCP